MKFEQQFDQYIDGSSFENGINLPISQAESQIITRPEFLDKKLAGKKVVHLGCCDHLPLIKEKIDRGLWLHKRVTNIADQCLGVDIDKEALAYVQNDLGFDNVVYGDITKSGIDQVAQEKWDFILIGEILEHIDNPVDFLSGMRENYGHAIKRAIITVPNAFALANFHSVKNHEEVINSDHRYWFSPYTLAKIAHQAGMKMEEFHFMQEVQPTIGRRARLQVFPYLKRQRRISALRKYPAYRDTLMVILSFGE